jgi:hypothetical protein
MTAPLDLEAIKRRAQQYNYMSWEGREAHVDRRDLIAEVERLRPMLKKLANYVESATEIIEDDGGDEEDARDSP